MEDGHDGSQISRVCERSVGGHKPSSCWTSTGPRATSENGLLSPSSCGLLGFGLSWFTALRWTHCQQQSAAAESSGPTQRSRFHAFIHRCCPIRIVMVIFLARGWMGLDAPNQSQSILSEVVSTCCSHFPSAILDLNLRFHSLPNQVVCGFLG